MHPEVCGYYHLFSAPLARRYLEKLDRHLDCWEIHFLRRGYGLLRRGVAEGAISALNYLELPPDRRAAVFSGPITETMIDAEERTAIRAGLERLLETERARPALPIRAVPSSRSAMPQPGRG